MTADESSQSTQATQLLGRMLTDESTSRGALSMVQPHSSLLKESVTEQLSSDESTGSLHVPSQFHLHGLAATQTQTQTQTQARPDDPLENESSQKENTPPDHESRQIAASPPPLTPTTPHGATMSTGIPSSHNAPHDSSHINRAKRPERTGTFLSPALPPPRQTNLPSRSRTYPAPAASQRSLSPTSQDSFAQDLIVEDPASAYVARDPQFNLTAAQFQDNSDSLSIANAPNLPASRTAVKGTTTMPKVVFDVPESQGSLDFQARSQQTNNSQEFGRYSSSQNAQVIMSQQFASSQVVPPQDLGLRPSDWDPSQQSDPATQIEEEEDLDMYGEPTQQVVDMYGTGVSGELTQPVSDDETQAEPSTRSPVVGTLPLAPVAGPSLASIPSEMPSTSRRAARSLAATVPGRVARLRKEGYAIPAQPEYSPLPPATTAPRALEPDAAEPLASSSDRHGDQTLKRPYESEDVSPTRVQHTRIDEVGTSLAVLRSPPRKRHRADYDTEDVVPDSEPIGPDDVMVPSSLSEHGKELERPERFEEQPSVTNPQTGDVTVDIVPESIELSQPADFPSSDDRPLSSTIPKRLAPSATANMHPSGSSSARGRRHAPHTSKCPRHTSLDDTPGSNAVPAITAATRSARQQSRPNFGNLKLLAANSPAPSSSESYSPTVRGTPVAEDRSPGIDAEDPAGPVAGDSDASAEPSTLSKARPRRRQNGKSAQGKAQTRKKPSVVPRAADPVVSRGSTSLSGWGDDSGEAPANFRSPGLTSADGPGLRVFGYWKNDRHYYAGTIQYAVGTQCSVSFDDGYNATLEPKDVRRFELRPGDQVRWDKKNLARVDKIMQAKGVESVRLVATIKGGQVMNDVPLAKVKIPVNIVNTAWQDRLLDPSDLRMLQMKNEGIESPSLRRSPSKRSTVSNVGGGGEGVFAGFGFVLSAHDKDSEKTAPARTSLQSRLEGGDGTVFEDAFTTMFELNGQHENTGRWVARQEHIVYTASEDIERIYLISNQPSQKPKYLMALALGIPCVSRMWVEESLQKQEILDWRSYLLDAGTCTTLGGTVSQQVYLKWGDDPRHIRELPFSSTLLSGKDILVLDKTCFPSADLKKRPYAAAQDIPRIVLAMGAERVEAVQSKNHASKPLDEYDYVVLKDSARPNGDDSIKYVPWTWVKDCLIANRLLPLPLESDKDEDAEDE